MRRPLGRLLLWLLYAVALGGVAWLTWRGAGFYATPLVERPHHPDYWLLKPGGARGHLVGVVGSTLMVVMLLYSLRRRWRPLRRFGALSSWLQFHIFCGVVGPLLVVLHSSFKVTGLVALSFWSMIVVAASGVLGRYLYIQIPRRRSGDALTLEETEEHRRSLARRLVDDLGLDPAELEAIDALAATGLGPRAGLARVLLRLPWEGLALRFRVRRYLARVVPRGAPANLARQIGSAVAERALLERRILLWDRLHRLFHYWHVLHKPFAVVMYLFMIVHVAVALLTGYAWGGGG